MQNKSKDKSSKALKLNSSPTFSFIFFGSSPISVTALHELEKSGLLPVVVVTQPDKPQGRGLSVLPSPVKVWAEKRNIEVLTPESLESLPTVELSSFKTSLGVLVSYGKIIPKKTIEIFPKGILNLHPSLLPLLRGPSPIESTILNDMKNEVGVTIMLLNEKMDEGPILAQKKIIIENWPPRKSELYETLSREGAELLTSVLPEYIAEKISPVRQNDLKATYSEKIKKSYGFIDLLDDPYKNFLKIRAFEGWPGTFFIAKHNGKNIRVKITDASYENGELKILKVIPEAKKEMSYEDFKRGIAS